MHFGFAVRRTLLAGALVATAALLPSAASASSGGVGPGSGSSGPVGHARLVGRHAVAPKNAPRPVVRAIKAANRIATGKPYCYGGGHRQWESRCYDCSGSVSYALGARGARVLKAPMASGPLEHWGRAGHGRWITVYANGGHAWAVIAGLRFDTSMTPGDGPGWSKDIVSRKGFRARHPAGL